MLTALKLSFFGFAFAALPGSGRLTKHPETRTFRSLEAMTAFSASQRKQRMTQR
jgi:hypothetical protein